MFHTDLIDAYHGYIECALWSSHDNSDESGGEPFDANYDIDDLAPEAVLDAMLDLINFIHDNYADCLRFLAVTGDVEWSSVGHNFWLTRNRHGAGFWDRGAGDVGTRLTDAAHVYGSSDLYLGDDGKIYCQ